MSHNFHVKLSAFQRPLLVYSALCSCLLVVSARAQQQEPEDPEDEKKVGLWLDQGISTGLSSNSSLEVEFHQRFDEGASNLFEYLVQAGVAFRPRPWLTVIPIYRYQRFPGNPAITYENRLVFNVTLSTARGPWRYNLRTLIEGRFPDDRPASARLRFRPGVDYTLPLRMTWRPAIIVSNEFFLVPWSNPFANGGSSYTQNRVQVGVRLPVTNSLSARPYFLLQSVNFPPAGTRTKSSVSRWPSRFSAKPSNVPLRKAVLCRRRGTAGDQISPLTRLAIQMDVRKAEGMNPRLASSHRTTTNEFAARQPNYRSREERGHNE